MPIINPLLPYKHQDLEKEFYQELKNIDKIIHEAATEYPDINISDFSSTAKKNIYYIKEFAPIIPDEALSNHIKFLKDWIIKYNTVSEQYKITTLHELMFGIASITDEIKQLIIESPTDDKLTDTITSILKEKIPIIEESYKTTTKQLQDIINTNKQQIDRLIKESQEAIEKTAEYNKLKTTQTFNRQNNILSEQFDTTRKNYQKERNWYLIFGIGLSIALGVFYLRFFFCQFTPDTPINYHNHLMLIAVCSPIILLTIWIFYQAGRLTRLIDTYTHKANLGYTLKNTIDYLKDTDTSANKEATLATLQALIKSLHESPVKQEKNSRVVQQNLSQITTLLKEIKDLSPSPK